MTAYLVTATCIGIAAGALALLAPPYQQWRASRRASDQADAIANDAHWAAIRIPQQRQETP